MADSSRLPSFGKLEEERIVAIRQLREEATDLRRNVSAGSYGVDELKRFYSLIDIAESTLEMPNSSLSDRAGLGSGFFATVSRDGRNPKLQNFLRSLTSIIEVSNERLVHVDGRSISGDNVIRSRIERDRVQLLSLAQSLGVLAREEISRLNANLPNDPDAIAKHQRQRELMEIFADGFEQITKALDDLGENLSEPLFSGRAAAIVKSLSDKIVSWWEANGAEAIDWAIRTPVFVGGVATLGWAGADMTVGTTAMAALVGGQKVFDAIQNRKK